MSEPIEMAFESLREVFKGTDVYVCLDLILKEVRIRSDVGNFTLKEESYIKKWYIYKEKKYSSFYARQLFNEYDEAVKRISSLIYSAKMTEALE